MEKNIYIQPKALKMLRKLFQTWPGWADKNFQGGTNFFSTIVEKFYPRIKIFGGDNFFLDRQYKCRIACANI